MIAFIRNKEVVDFVSFFDSYFS